jgi:hypothetical protein
MVGICRHHMLQSVRHGATARWRERSMQRAGQGDTAMKRLWGIRHVRYVYWHCRTMAYLRECRRLGLGYYLCESDQQVLQDIWDGKL